MKRTIIFAGIASVATALAAVLAGCGGGEGPGATATATQARPSATATQSAATAGPASPTVPPSEPTSIPAPPTQTPAEPTPASVATVSAPAPTLPPPPTAPPPPAGGSATIAAVNTSFVPSSLSLGVGTATITLDNQDAGVTHDLVIFEPSGAQVAASDLFAGPGARVITVSLEPGNYAFKCSVHPLEMRGVINVQ